MPTPTSPIGQTIKHQREQLGLTQTAAAQQAGISRRAWSEVELGRRRGSPDTLSKMDLVLQLPSGSLLAMEVKVVDPLASIRQELIDMVTSLTTREELEQTRLDMTRRRLAILQAQLEQYESAVGRRTVLRAHLQHEPGDRHQAQPGAEKHLAELVDGRMNKRDHRGDGEHDGGDEEQDVGGAGVAGGDISEQHGGSP
jgi:transcriptional regulator with XRE-family HTH domain